MLELEDEATRSDAGVTMNPPFHDTEAPRDGHLDALTLASDVLLGVEQDPYRRPLVIEVRLVRNSIT